MWMLHPESTGVGRSYPRGLMPASPMMASVLFYHPDKPDDLSFSHSPSISLLLSHLLSPTVLPYLTISWPTVSLVTLLFSALWEGILKKQVEEKHLSSFFGHLWNRNVWHCTEEHSWTETLRRKSVQWLMSLKLRGKSHCGLAWIGLQSVLLSWFRLVCSITFHSLCAYFWLVWFKSFACLR